MTNTSVTPPENGSLRNVEGEDLAVLAERAAAIAAILADRAEVEMRADTGDAERPDALARPALTIVRDNGSTLTLSILDLALLAELGNATASAESTARVSGSRGASACHVVPGTLRRHTSGEFRGGLSVTGGWLRETGDLGGLSGGFRRIRVLLTASANTYLTYPVRGELHVFEMSTDGYVIRASFRPERPDGITLGASVEVRRPVFTYEPRPTAPVA